MKRSLTLLISLFPAAVLAHPGHMSIESVHSLLHTEHVLVLVAVGIIAYAFKQSRKK